MANCSRFVALHTAGNAPVTELRAVLLRCSAIKALIRTKASTRLISCQRRDDLPMAAALIYLSEHLLAGKVEQFAGGNRRNGLLEVAHGVKSSAV